MVKPGIVTTIIIITMITIIDLVIIKCFYLILLNVMMPGQSKVGAIPRISMLIF